MKATPATPTASTTPAASASHRRDRDRGRAPWTETSSSWLRRRFRNSADGRSSGSRLNASRSAPRSRRRASISVRHDAQVSRCRRISWFVSVSNSSHRNESATSRTSRQFMTPRFSRPEYSPVTTRPSDERCVRRGELGPQLRAASMEPRHHRPNGNRQRFRGFLVGEVFHITEQDDLLERRRQSAQCSKDEFVGELLRHGRDEWHGLRDAIVGIVHHPRAPCRSPCGC